MWWTCCERNNFGTGTPTGRVTALHRGQGESGGVILDGKTSAICISTREVSLTKPGEGDIERRSAMRKVLMLSVVMTIMLMPLLAQGAGCLSTHTPIGTVQPVKPLRRRIFRQMRLPLLCIGSSNTGATRARTRPR